MRIIAALAFAGPAALLLAACGTPDEVDLIEDAADRPESAEIAVAPDEDGQAFDPEIGRPAFEAAMREVCPEAPIAGAECRATEEPTQFACEYTLIDGTRGEMLHATIAREGEEWVLLDPPAQCPTAETQN